MGTAALLSSGVTGLMLYLIRDRTKISHTDPLNKVRRSRILIFLIVELIGFGATFAVTQVSRLRDKLMPDHRRDRFPGHHHAAGACADVHHPPARYFQRGAGYLGRSCRQRICE
jgi:hypothetical protein